MPETTLENLPATRQAILVFLKSARRATVRQVAHELEVSYEAARQQLAVLQQEGWIDGRLRRDGSGGRPALYYGLTVDGEGLFPKAYDQLTIEMIDATVEQLGPAALNAVLERLTAKRVSLYRPRLEGLTLRKKLEALADIYMEDDPFISVEGEGDDLRLVERNCPFFNVARARPALCSLTVSTLQQLLGVRVTRDERFQNGDGRCVFRPHLDQPLEADAPVFAAETDPKKD